MGKIDLRDKFVHSPNFQRDGLGNFKSILTSGFIGSPSVTGVKSFWHIKDNVYLGMHPNGDLTKKYKPTTYTGFNSTNGYEMATSGVFFILNSSLENDYTIIPGAYDHEGKVLHRIDLYKYLEGIGNAGYYIGDRLTYCYYFIKLANGELMNTKQLIQIVRERNLRCNLSMTIDNIGYRVPFIDMPNHNYINYVLSKSPEEHLHKGYYDEIVDTLREEGKDIPLYNKFGELIEPEKCLVKVKKMYDYVERNKDIKMGDSYFESVKKICDSLK